MGAPHGRRCMAGPLKDGWRWRFSTADQGVAIVQGTAQSTGNIMVSTARRRQTLVPGQVLTTSPRTAAWGTVDFSSLPRRADCAAARQRGARRPFRVNRAKWS